MLDDVGKTTPQYMEGMEQVFEQCQQFEEKRLVFLKEVLLDIKRHLNLAENSRYLAQWAQLAGLWVLWPTTERKEGLLGVC